MAGAGASVFEHVPGPGLLALEELSSAKMPTPVLRKQQEAQLILTISAMF